jgi:hypothetical protein
MGDGQKEMREVAEQEERGAADVEEEKEGDEQE